MITIDSIEKERIILKVLETLMRLVASTDNNLTDISNPMPKRATFISIKFVDTYLHQADSLKHFYDMVAAKLYDMKKKHTQLREIAYNITNEQLRLDLRALMTEYYALHPPKTPSSLFNLSFKVLVAQFEENPILFQKISHLDIVKAYHSALLSLSITQAKELLTKEPSLIKVTNSRGQNAFHLLYLDPKTRLLDLKLLMQLLEPMKVAISPSIRQEIFTFLMSAISANCFDINRLINHRDNNGQTPLHLAMERASEIEIKTLVNQCRPILNTYDLKGKQPIRSTTSIKKKEILKRCLSDTDFFSNDYKKQKIEVAADLKKSRHSDSVFKQP